MKGQLAFEALGSLPEDLITEAAEYLGFMPVAGGRTSAVDSSKRAPSALSRFFESGWGVALICAVVSLSVLSGIVWAGQRPPSGGPGGTNAESTEGETLDYMGEEQTDVWVKSGGETVYPQEFFLWSGPADGLGFYGTVQDGQTPVLPVAYYSRSPYDDTNEIFFPDTHALKQVTLYDQSMTDITDEKHCLLLLSERDFSSFASVLMPGKYYLSLYVEKQTDGGETVGCDYAFELRVQNTAEDIQPGEEANSYQKAWVALRDQLLSEGEPYKQVSSYSELSLPVYESGIMEGHENGTEKYRVLMGVDTLGNIVMAYDYYRALVVLRLQTDGSMRISVESAGNYHCVETVTPPARIDSDFRFTDKNEWYSSVSYHDAPLYYLLNGMAYLDESMGKLDGEFSFEALGYAYAKKNG